MKHYPYGGSTAERLDASFKVEPAGRFEVRGKAEPLEVFRLLPWTAAVTSGDRGSGGAVK